MDSSTHADLSLYQRCSSTFPPYNRFRDVSPISSPVRSILENESHQRPLFPCRRLVYLMECSASPVNRSILILLDHRCTPRANLVKDERRTRCFARYCCDFLEILLNRNPEVRVHSGWRIENHFVQRSSSLICSDARESYLWVHRVLDSAETISVRIPHRRVDLQASDVPTNRC